MNSSITLPESIPLNPRYNSWCAAGESIYYCGEGGIFRCSPDGSGSELLCPVTGYVFTTGGSVFCGNLRCILRLKDDGSSETLLKVSPLVNEAYFRMMNCLRNFTPDGDRIYYILTLYESHILCVIHTDGTGDRQLGPVCNVLNTITGITVGPESIEVAYTTEKGEAYTVIFEE